MTEDFNSMPQPPAQPRFVDDVVELEEALAITGETREAFAIGVQTRMYPGWIGWPDTRRQFRRDPVTNKSVYAPQWRRSELLRAKQAIENARRLS